MLTNVKLTLIVEDAIEDVAEVFSLNVARFAGNSLECRLETNNPIILLRISWRWLKGESRGRGIEDVMRSSPHQHTPLQYTVFAK